MDELGPLAVKTYPGEEWKVGPYRATFEPDYGRRGKLWVHGAFEPATGQATLVLSAARDSASHIQLLGGGESFGASVAPYLTPHEERCPAEDTSSAGSLSKAALPS